MLHSTKSPEGKNELEERSLYPQLCVCQLPFFKILVNSGIQICLKNYSASDWIRTLLECGHGYPTILVKSIHYKVVCLFLRNSHKISRQAGLNVCTESGTILCAFLKNKQTTLYINITTLVAKTSAKFWILLIFVA